MNYKNFLKQQIKNYILGVLAMGTTYTITRYFGWREATTLSIEYFISFSLTFIFLGAFFYMHLINSLKNK